MCTWDMLADRAHSDVCQPCACGSPQFRGSDHGVSWRYATDRHAPVQAQRAEEARVAEERRLEKERRSYKNLHDEDAMTSNRDVAGKYATAEDFEDDFM